MAGAMHVYVLGVFTLLHISSATVNAKALPGEGAYSNLDDGYYWREYSGEIPKDALEGGKNANGKPIYIGQVLHKGQLIPAKIDAEAKRVYYEWDYKEYEGTNNIKILCTRHPEQFEWINTGNGFIQNIKDKHLVIGGHEAGVKIYIGRKQLQSELVIGKIISTELQSTLNTTEDGNGIQHPEFQLLAYNPDAVKKKKGGNGGIALPGVDIKVEENYDPERSQQKIVITIVNN